MAFCGDNKYLTAVKLIGRSARHPTQDISQGLFINTVVLEDVELTLPPSVLATIPLLIRNPSNLKYNRGIPATRATIDSMIDLVYYQPDVCMTFLLPDGRRYDGAVPATTTIRDVCDDFLSVNGLDAKDVLLVRQLSDGTELRLPLCNMPIGLFDVEDSKWSFEFRFLPRNMPPTVSNKRMLKLYLMQRSSEFHTKEDVKAPVFETIDRIINEKTIADEKMLRDFLEELHTRPKYEPFVKRTFTIGEINVVKFTMNRDGSLSLQRNSTEPKVYDPSEMVIKKGNNEFVVMVDGKTYYVPSNKFQSFYEFINHAFMPIWETVPKHSFDFELPQRTETKIPRVFKDSRSNHIKHEYLQRVIEEQIELGKKLANSK